MPSRSNRDLALYGGLNPGTQYCFEHGSGEHWGVHNGQFEVGPSGQDESDPPEGWQYTAISAGGTFLRTTGGYAGNWCARGGRAGVGDGVSLFSQKYMPVSTAYNYYYQVAACQTNNGVLRVGVICYSAAKASLGIVWQAAAFIPATAYPTWTLYNYVFGPAGTALAANTRYVRLYLCLQANAALAGAYTYVDDVKFQQIPAWLWGMLPQ